MLGATHLHLRLFAKLQIKLHIHTSALILHLRLNSISSCRFMSTYVCLHLFFNLSALSHLLNNIHFIDNFFIQGRIGDKIIQE